MSRQRGTTPDDLAPVWKALANEVRRRILDLLVEEPVATGTLAEHFPELSRFAVMQHLRVLEDGGLVIRRKQGKRHLLECKNRKRKRNLGKATLVSSADLPRIRKCLPYG